jgi:hypothetical protein
MMSGEKESRISLEHARDMAAAAGKERGDEGRRQPQEKSRKNGR